MMEPNEYTSLMSSGDGFIDIDPDVISTSPKACVEFLNLEDRVFKKVQCRKGGHARQIIEEGQPVEMKAIYSAGSSLMAINGWIRRMYPESNCITRGSCDLNIDSAIFKEKDTVMNMLENRLSKEGEDEAGIEVIDGHEFRTIKFFVDFNRVYEEDPKNSMFNLFKTEGDKKNRFILRIQLVFRGEYPSDIFDSPVFRCRTKKKTDNDPIESPSKPPPTPASPPLTTLVTDSLIARTAIIDDLVLGNLSTCETMSTSKADIAYHLKIKDEEVGMELEEGDVVGFFTDEDDGGTYIKLLRSSDAESAVHAGVVSRSAYINANKAIQAEDESDTVCVIGIVNVKVIGSVENGERIYSSINRPGKAVPQSHLPVGSFLRKKHVLLGTAMERKDPKSLDEEHLVKCFVCIVLDVGRMDVLEEVEVLYETSEKQTHYKIKMASKRAWKRLRCCFAVTFVFFILLCTLLYQIFVPGTWFRYWLCSRGSLNGELWVSVVPFRTVTQIIDVHGIRFSYEGLKKKVPDRFTANVRTGNKTVYYFLNLDRCAYFGDYGPVRDYISGQYKEIGGGKILSLNHNCTKVYWYGLLNDTKYRIDWHPYVSAHNLECSPNPPFR